MRSPTPHISGSTSFDCYSFPFAGRGWSRRPLLAIRKRSTVANIKSQIKRNRQNETRRARNRTVRSELRTRTRRANELAGTDDGPEALRLAIKRIDKAAQNGTIHKNTAARYKSRLVKRVNAAGEAS